MTKHFVMLAAAVAVVAFAALFAASYQIASESHAQCNLAASGQCLIYAHFPAWSWLGLAALAALAAAGIYMLLRLSGEEKIAIKTTAEAASTIKKLSGDSKAVFDAVAAEGTVFQSDLIRKTGFSKVKVSRILDRLEMTGLVERRRRGMANVIVLKQKA